MLLSLATVLLVTSSALASFHLPRQSNSSTCTNKGAVPNGGPWDLVAFDKTQPNTGGDLLVLSPIDPTDTNHLSLATVSSSLNGHQPTRLNLTNGALLAQSQSVAGLQVPQTGGPLAFQNVHTLADIYCAVAPNSTHIADNTSPEPVLSVYGDADNFAICQVASLGLEPSTDSGTPLDILIYKPNANSSILYDIKTCRAVVVELINGPPLSESNGDGAHANAASGWGRIVPFMWIMIASVLFAIL